MTTIIYVFGLSFLLCFFYIIKLIHVGSLLLISQKLLKNCAKAPLHCEQSLKKSGRDRPAVRRSLLAPHPEFADRGYVARCSSTAPAFFAFNSKRETGRSLKLL